MKNFKRVFVVAWLLLMLGIGFMTYYRDSSTVIIAFNVIPLYSVALSFAIVYVFAIFVGRKTLKWVGGVLCLVCQLYGIWVMFDYYLRDEMFLASSFYLYVVLMILLVISMFIKDENDNKASLSDTVDNISALKNEVVNNAGNNGQAFYLIGTYIHGIDKLRGMKKCALSYKESDSYLTFIVIEEDGKALKYNLSCGNVKIESKKRFVMEQVQPKKVDHTFDNTILATALFGALGTAVAQSSLLDSMNKYDMGFNYKTLYEITIHYPGFVNGKCLIQTYEGPSNFLSGIEKVVVVDNK